MPGCIANGRIHLATALERPLHDITLPHGDPSGGDEAVGPGGQPDQLVPQHVGVVADDPSEERGCARVPQPSVEGEGVRVVDRPVGGVTPGLDQLVAGGQHHHTARGCGGPPTRAGQETQLGAVTATAGARTSRWTRPPRGTDVRPFLERAEEVDGLALDQECSTGTMVSAPAGMGAPCRCERPPVHPPCPREVGRSERGPSPAGSPARPSWPWRCPRLARRSRPWPTRRTWGDRVPPPRPWPARSRTPPGAAARWAPAAGSRPGCAPGSPRPSASRRIRGPDAARRRGRRVAGGRWVAGGRGGRVHDHGA